LIDQGIIQNKTLRVGNNRPDLMHGEDTKFRAGYITLKSRSRGRARREEVHIRLEKKTIR